MTHNKEQELKDINDASVAGWNAAVSGEGRDSNPHLADPLRTAWWRGYDSAVAAGKAKEQG